MIALQVGQVWMREGRCSLKILRISDRAGVDIQEMDAWRQVHRMEHDAARGLLSGAVLQGSDLDQLAVAEARIQERDEWRNAAKEAECRQDPAIARENNQLRSRLAAAEKVVQAAREHRTKYIGIGAYSFVTQPGVKMPELRESWSGLCQALSNYDSTCDKEQSA